MVHHQVFIGTYTHSGSRGIHSVQLDPATGTLSAPALAAETPNPTYLALTRDRRFLYAVHSSPALAAAFSIEPASARLTPLPAPLLPAAKEPCYVAVDEAARLLLVAHYHEGFVGAIPLRDDGGVGAPPQLLRHRGPGSGVVPDRQQKSFVHCSVLSPDGRFVFACDLGEDRIYCYRVDPATRMLAPANPPFTATAPGAGPRHVVFSRDGRHLLCIAELDGTIASYAYNPATGALALRDAHSTLPPNFHGKNTTAAIRVHPNGRFVYGSNRGHDSLAAFEFDEASGALAPVEIVPCGGRGPRDFALSPDGRWLVVANQDSNSLTVVAVDPATGRLAGTGGPVSVPAPVCVLFVR
ncbi:MAG TPA: lactonase family protein [Opitutus sp.]|nr:lactonase family protein [Opitutus sp.]